MAKIEIDRDTLIKAVLEELTPQEAAKLLARIILKANGKGIKTVETPLTPETIKQIGIQYGNLFKTPSEIAKLNNTSLSNVQNCLRKLGYILPEDSRQKMNIKKRNPERLAKIREAIRSGVSNDEIVKQFGITLTYLYQIKWQEKRKK